MSQDTVSRIEKEPRVRSKKRSADEAELEIDVHAPEPPSKKALRKAKKQATQRAAQPEAEAEAEADALKTEEPDLKRLNGIDSERSDYGVWIGNLAFATNKKDLYNFLISKAIPAESITRLHLPPGNDGRSQNKGFAYVDFNSQDFVDKAVQLSESLLGGRRLLIKDAKNFQGRPEKSKEQKAVSTRAPSRKIFVGNLDFETTVQDLEKHFSVCGPIMKTQMASFQDSGKCKGYAWIEFESLSAAEGAMRGWVEVDKPTKGPAGKEEMKTKKIWLHRMGERKMRMEFAEDATTRYKKRYGNEFQDTLAERRGNDEQQEAIVEVESQSARDYPKREGSHHQRPSKAGRSVVPYQREERRSGKEKNNSRYDEQTVKKLTGAIVKGAGSKVVFD